MPFLTQPLALLGLAALPALVAVYLLHRQPKPIDVSSLMLWAVLRRPHAGGRRIEPPRFPLSFWLEALIIVLLIGAAAGPMLPRLNARRALVVVLDDSLSMQAASGDSTARERAHTFLEREVLGGSWEPVRFVRAGATPQVMGKAITSKAAALAQLEQWTPASPAADMESAISLAMQLPERNALILVVSDAPPPRTMGSRVRWMAFGEGGVNVGFVAASRWMQGSRDLATFELANFSGTSASVALRVVAGGQDLRRERIPIGPNARRAVSLELPPRTEAVDLLINDDAAPYDNRVTLLPHDRRPVRVSVDVADERLRSDVERAVEATARAIVVPSGDLLITDRPAPSSADWTVQFLTGKGTAHIGPFLVDHTVPLTDGLGLGGVIWSAPGADMPGVPVITTGSKVLVADESVEGRHHVRIAFDPALSNLQKSPAWPALLWNMVEWRRASQPGFRSSNVGVGSPAELVVAPAQRDVRITSPSGRTRLLQVSPFTGSVPVLSTEPGVWSATAGSETYRFASNALVPAESDLEHRESGEKASWGANAFAPAGYANIAPLLLVGALAIAATHQHLTAGARA